MEMDFAMFLQYLISGGGSILAASFILERFPKYKELSSAELKDWIFFGVASFIGVGAYLLVTLAPDFMVLAEPYFIILAGIFSFVFLGKDFHKKDKLPNKYG